MLISIWKILTNFNNPSLLLEASASWQIGYKNPSSAGYEGLIVIHDSVLFYLVLILVCIFWVLFSLIRYLSSADLGEKFKNYLNIIRLLLILMFVEFITLIITKFYNEINTLNTAFSMVPVIWGQILSSAIGQPRKLTNLVQSMISLTKYQQSVLIGIILSDGSFDFSTGRKNCCLVFGQSLEKFEYFWSVYNIFKNITRTLPHLTLSYKNGTPCYKIRFNTRSLPCLSAFYSLFYQNRIKKISPELFYFIDELCLAHWICCDGGVHGSGLRLHTQSFTLQECVLLINILIIKFDLQCSIHKDKGKPVIYIKANSMAKLKNLVSKHMVPSMLYKIHM